MNKFQTSKKDI